MEQNMKQTVCFGLWFALLLLLGWPVVAFCQTGLISSEGQSLILLTGQYQQFMDVISGDWQKYGQAFTELQNLFIKIFAGVIVGVCLAFFLHYLVIGAKHFSHDGEKILFFNVFSRLIHWIAALSFSLLVCTGLMVIFGRYLGGGMLGNTARLVHIGAAIVFSGNAILMFLIWFKDMLPKAYDIKWLFILGGYLSKEKKPIPAGKFNAGQKMWFWGVSLGGMVLAISGYMLNRFDSGLDILRIASLTHNFLAAALLAVYITHLYMALFAIKGALSSMKTGYKPIEEVEILHSRYVQPEKELVVKNQRKQE